MLQSWHREISQFGSKALSIATLATIMIACVAGVFDNGDASPLGEVRSLLLSPNASLRHLLLSKLTNECSNLVFTKISIRRRE